MINVSSEFKTQMQHDTNFTEHAVMRLQNGEVLHLEASDFTVENNNFVDGASSTSFPLGVAVSKTIQIEIANFDEQYSNIDFFGAVIKLYIDYYLQESQTTESVLFGDFTVVSPETYGDTIIISAVDNMYIADKKYESNLVYPASLQTIFVSACNELSIAYQSADFRNKDYVVQKKPVDITYRQLFGYIAMIACGNARFNQYGALEIKSYDVELLESYERNISGGTFNTETIPYSDGDSYDGGTFSYADGDTLDGGTFDNWNVTFILDQWSRLKVDTDDVVITGISVTYSDEDNNEHTAMYGANGYVLNIVNPLIDGDEQNAVNRIGSYLVGIKFRVFDGDYIANPLIEFMDVVAISDRKLNTYISIVTDVSFEFFGKTSIKNNSESALRNSSIIYSDSVRTLIEARKLVQAEKSAREVAIEQLAYELANSNGLYMTTDVQPDGSTIYYMHNKPMLSDSMIVWKMTSTALGISTDGGQTYPYGLDVSGNAILNKIYAIGLDADYIRTGALTVDDGRGNILFNADFNRKQVTIKALDNYMDRQTTEAYIDVKSNAIMAEVTDKTSLFNSERNLIIGGTNLELDAFNHSEDAYVGIRFGKPCIVLGDGMFFTETPYLSTHLIIGTGTYKFEFEAFVSGSFEADEVGTCVITVKDSATQNIVEEHTYRIGKKIEDERVYEWRLFGDNITVDRNCDVDIVFTLVDFAEELRIAKIELVGGYENLDQAITSLTSFINQTASNVSIEVSRAKKAEEALSSAIDINATEISAKVSKSGGSASSFGWSLLDNSFKLFSGNKTVFNCDSSGITINGYTKTDDLQAKVATFGYATVAELNAQKARIDTINSNYITASSVASNYATIGSLNSSNARISSLEADHVSVSTINSMNATIRGKLTTSNLASEISSLGQVTISSLFKLGDYMVRWQSMTVKNGNGQNVTIRYLGR